MRYLNGANSGNPGIAIQRMNFPDKDRSPYTQPPLFASAVKQAYVALSRLEPYELKNYFGYDAPEDYLRSIYPLLKKAYTYFTSRDYLMGQDGLIRLNTPHATGMDSTPAYFKAKMVLLQKSLKERFPRRNFRFLTSENFLNQRLLTEKDAKVLKFIAMDSLGLLNLDHEHMKSGWELQKTLETFHIEDVSLNCIVANNVRDMASIAQILGIEFSDDASQYAFQAQALEDAILEKMWNPSKGLFYSYAQGEMTDVATISSLFPVTLKTLAQPKHREKLLALLEKMESYDYFNARFPFPSVARKENLFDPDYRTKGRIWLGPTWINTSYLIMEGMVQLMAELKETDLVLAERCRRKAIDVGIRIGELVNQFGSAEFYQPDYGYPERLVVYDQEKQSTVGKGFTWSYLGHLMYYRARYLEERRSTFNVYDAIDEADFQNYAQRCLF